MLGGTSIIPGLKHRSQGSMGEIPFSPLAIKRTNQEKQMEIVEYLKKLPPDKMATFVDIERVLRIDLTSQSEVEVLEMIKSNPLIDRSKAPDGIWSFQFRKKFVIRNKNELKQNIDRIENGILVEDINTCYLNIGYDIQSLILGGDIIAAKNKEKRSMVLYPRGKRFLSRLSGTVTAVPGRQAVVTSANLRDEIRRGEAIQVDKSWYRVDTTVGSGSAGEQMQRNAAPCSVTMDKDLSDRNKYCNDFNPNSLPLDGDFDGEKQYVGVVLKHGCTNDVKDCWKRTAEELKKFIGDNSKELLQQELVELKLLKKPFIGSQEAKRRMGRATKEKKERAKRKPRETTSTGFGVNAHLRGGQLEKLFKSIV